MPDEKAVSAVAFLKAAVAYYKSLGVSVARVMTDNGSCYKSLAFARACRRLKIKHIRTKPYTRTKCACAASLVRDIVERATITADRIEIRLGKQKQRPAHDDALRGLAGTMASPQIMCIRAKADIVEKPKPEPSH